MTQDTDPRHPHWAIRTRRSVRRFTDEPVDRATLASILDTAGHTASGHNIQPWKVYVVEGDTKQQVTNAIMTAVQTEPEEAHQPEFDYYPTEWLEPYISRRREVGFMLYELLGIERSDKAGRARQMNENFRFFGAPTGLFLTIDRRLATGTYMDIGMFLQSILVAARMEGLDTCAQAVFTWYHKVLRQVLPMEDHELLVCGISIGHAVPDAPENQLMAPKLGSDAFTTYCT